MTTPVQIPADVDREDRLLADLTARQLIILTTAALAVYLVWTVTGAAALIVFAASAAPLGLAGLVLAFGRRDGVSADRLLWAALTQRRHTPRAPHRPTDIATAEIADPDPRRAAVARRRARPRTARTGRLVLPRVPARRVLAAGPDLGVVDLGRDGWAVVCAVTPVNFTLRSGPERDVLLAGFARWLHSLAAPVQILTRTHPVDLSATITGLRHAASRLPHPALAAAASAHADHLHELGSAAELLHREFLIVFRTPTPITAARSRAPGPGRERWGRRRWARRRRIERLARLSPRSVAAPMRPSGCWAGSGCASPPSTRRRPPGSCSPPHDRSPAQRQAPGRPRPDRACPDRACPVRHHRPPWHNRTQRADPLPPAGRIRPAPPRTAAESAPRASVWVSVTNPRSSSTSPLPRPYPRPARSSTVPDRAPARARRSTLTFSALPVVAATMPPAPPRATPLTRPSTWPPATTMTRSSAPTAPPPADASDRSAALAIAAAIAAALTPHGPTERARRPAIASAMAMGMSRWPRT